MLNTCPARKSVVLYEPRHPRKTHYFQCVQHHFEDLETAWDDRYQHQYGFFRPYVRDVIWRKTRRRVWGMAVRGGIEICAASPMGL